MLLDTQRDFKEKLNHANLDKVCHRATPHIWSAFATASLVIKIPRNGSPKNLYGTILENLKTERRKPNKGRFYNNATGKVGLHALKNRPTFMCDLDFNWLNVDLSNFVIQIKIKKFLNFNFT